eukprot:11743295-Ditylum_brightwellii.AAC.1
MKQQHCSDQRGIKPKTFLPNMMTPEPCEQRNQDEPEPQSLREFLPEKQSEPEEQRECVPKERSETIEPHKPKVQ